MSVNYQRDPQIPARLCLVRHQIICLRIISSVRVPQVVRPGIESLYHIINPIHKWMGYPSRITEVIIASAKRPAIAGLLNFTLITD